MTPFRIGTRGSALALWQARHVRDLLAAYAGTRPIEIVEIQTSGDVVRDVALSQIGGEGVFTKEIQRALLDGEVDVAVHSLKDLPTIVNDELTLAAVPPRGPIGDVLVSIKHSSFDSLPRRATVATSSLRRRAQILQRRHDLNVVDVRGNVETRLRKLEEQQLDGILLAEAGLVRLGLASVITEVLSTDWLLPAVGQGALGLECRRDDEESLRLVHRLNDPATHCCVLAERAVLRALGGGCHVPIGALARQQGDVLSLRATVLRPDGAERIVDVRHGHPSDAETIGRALAEALLQQGARELLSGRPG